MILVECKWTIKRYYSFSFHCQLKELREKLHEIKGDLGEKGKDLMRQIKEQARDYIKKLLKKYGLDKRAADDKVEEVLAELNYKDMLRKLKEHVSFTKAS